MYFQVCQGLYTYYIPNNLTFWVTLSVPGFVKKFAEGMGKISIEYYDRS